MQVARLAALGHSNKEIARELGVSDGTVKMHMHHVLGKLGMESRVSLRRLDWLQRTGANGGVSAVKSPIDEQLQVPTFF